MRQIETKAKTRQDAIQQALNDLGVELHEVEIEIIDEGSKGLLGFGQRDVHVRVKAESLPDSDNGQREGKPRRRRGGGGGGGNRDGRNNKPRQDNGNAQKPQEPTAKTETESAGDENDDSPNKPRRRRRNRGRRRGNNRPAAEQGSSTNESKSDTQQRQPRQSAAGNKRGGRGRGDSDRSNDRDRPRRNKPRRDEQMREERPRRERVEPLDPEKAAALAESGATILKEIIDKMDIDSQVTGSVTDDGGILIHVESEDSAILIGRKGSTLNAIQFILNRILLQGEEYGSVDRVVVDVERYRERRRESLEEMARELSEKAKETGRNMRVKPLSPQERRIIHLALEDEEAVRTYSLGNSMMRRVVIVPEGNDEGSDYDDDADDSYGSADNEYDDE